ncbi:MAG: M15 family metallopeptidase [Actinomycetota bacterium]|nr:M15 family metallopeptidase [Actinomycetota bacterium]
MRRALPAALSLALLATAACGGHATQPPKPVVAERPLTLPPPVPATPAFAVRLKEPVSPARIARVQRSKGIAVIAPISLGRIRARIGRRTQKLVVAAVDPLRLRPLVPAATRDADFVWTSLLEGKAALGFAAAKDLRAEASDSVRLGRRPTPIGAFADTGLPQTDVVVNEEVGIELALPDPTLLLVGTTQSAPLPAVGKLVRRSFPRAHVRRLSPAPAATEAPEDAATGTADGGEVIGAMTFRILRNGFIDPDPEWVAGNIASGEVPILGTVTCHRLVFQQLHAALSEIVADGLDELIDPDDYGGCYVPRFIDRDPGKPLSMHAFGLAFDINVSQNALGTEGNQDPRVVEILSRWGFEWGGTWTRPDPMHFELVRLVTP